MVMAGKEDAAAAYCANLAAAYERLAHVLAVPLIDQELYSCLFLHPLLHEHCAEARGFSVNVAAASAATFSPNALAVDHSGDALVALGGTELVVAALRAHEQQTLLVMHAIALRESVMTRIWACCRAYNDGQASLEEAQYTVLCLLEEHQVVTMLVVESVVEWRQALSRPYPFLLKNGDNYLINIVHECAALGATAVVRSLSHVHLGRDPMCASVDLRRLLHRLEIKHRTRLVNSGAMWKLGLHPLRAIASSRLPTGSAAGNACGSCVGAAPPSTCTAPKAHGSAPETQSYAGTSLDFLTEVMRLAEGLNKTGGRHCAPSPLPSASASTSSIAAGVSSSSGTTAALRRLPLPSPRGDAAVQQEKQRRLLTATQVLEKEASVQRMLVKDLYDLAHGQERFVPLLGVTGLFIPHDCGTSEKDIPADSWPLDKAAWPSLATMERRVDRLSCMSTAREALQAKHLLPAWERRMSNGMADLATSTGTRSSSRTTSLSFPAKGSRAPFQTMSTRAAPRGSVMTTTTRSSGCADSLESSDDTDSETFRMQREHTSPPREDAPSHATFSSTFHSTTPGFPSSSAVARAPTVAASLARHASSSSSSLYSPRATPSSSSSQTPSRKPSLKELRQQLLTERGLDSGFASMNC
ncbi:conserved hypothetical protein [Leishmania major strain Friedlin]|uniref:Uncharacterized protein n=1 Tax=Leishmania major TaxID=5664 RepID=Q4Q515_LEIMA|nr:conserved hypothetical protein [Leishmania major strain Friedlin]CAG9580397.1 hypothetical_protein_-_conserved [Leishmania major strain Friedlin]CAJ08787.1 conserved hypothetical protein [Leishmania major strain Friedlin]|eukprot:XP_001685583.1 conserved hypothetical protein [Leishmania major strain Friedlin]